MPLLKTTTNASVADEQSLQSPSALNSLQSSVAMQAFDETGNAPVHVHNLSSHNSLG